jgi:hypothetical protein
MALTLVSAVSADTISLHCGSRARTPNGVVGEVVALICDVGTTQISHLVVGAPGSVSRIVQVSCVRSGDGDWLEIELELQEVVQLEPFVARYEQPDSVGQAERGRPGLWLAPRGDFALIRPDGVPDAPLALRSPVPVRSASQRYVGHIVLWNLQCGSGRISSLVVREGQRFNHTDVVIPGSHIDHVDDDGVHLLSSSSRHRRARPGADY